MVKQLNKSKEVVEELIQYKDPWISINNEHNTVSIEVMSKIYAFTIHNEWDGQKYVLIAGMLVPITHWVIVALRFINISSYFMKKLYHDSNKLYLIINNEKTIIETNTIKIQIEFKQEDRIYKEYINIEKKKNDNTYYINYSKSNNFYTFRVLYQNISDILDAIMKESSDRV